MSFQEMSKEQKQLVILGVMSVVVVVALGNQLVIAPTKAREVQALELIKEKGGDKESGERLLRRDDIVRNQLREDFTWMRRARLDDRIPPVTGKEFWAQKRIRAIGLDLELDLTVSRHSPSPPRHIQVMPGARGGEDKASGLPFWIPYPMRVQGQVSYMQLNRFLSRLREEEPYASVAVLRIGNSLTDPTRHTVTVVVEWPVPRREEEWTDLETRLAEVSP